MDYHWNIDFGMTLRRLRKERNLSQEELAERSGLDRSYISLIERNLKLPGFISILALASGLGMRASDFMIEIEKHPEFLPIKGYWSFTNRLED